MVSSTLTSTLLQHLPWAIFVFCLGACVGSFLNVVVHRLPMGISLVSPPSRCPTCGGRLRFFRENLPILGWLLLRGKCRFCRERISLRYPLVELGTACFFLGMYVLLFWIGWRTPYWGEVGGEWWSVQGFAKGWPAYTILTFLFSGLFAMTVIDARTYTIPIQLPVFITIMAFLFWPLQSLLIARWTPVEAWPIPGVSWWWFMVAACGMIGVCCSRLLLARGVLKWSFADYDQYVKEGEPLAEYPHARREMGVELVYLMPIIIGLFAGGGLGMLLPEGGPPLFLQALGASMLGYLVGAGLVWIVRLLGTLAFGREAMGLGDVHLLGAVGACLGWFDPILVFFLAPFIGLSWVFIGGLLSVVSKGSRRELPYGPHLALAAALLFIGRPVVIDAWAVLVPTIQMPHPALVETVEAAEPRLKER